MDADTYERMKGRFANAKEGLGTVLFFEDLDKVEAMPTSDSMANFFKIKNNGMASLVTWLSLTDLGLGASLHHFNIGYEDDGDQPIKEALGIEDSWQLLGLMPFGSVEEPASPKDKMDSQDQVVHISE